MRLASEQTTRSVKDILARTPPHTQHTPVWILCRPVISVAMKNSNLCKVVRNKIKEGGCCCRCCCCCGWLESLPLQRKMCKGCKCERCRVVSSSVVVPLLHRPNGQQCLNVRETDCEQCVSVWVLIVIERWLCAECVVVVDKHAAIDKELGVTFFCAFIFNGVWCGVVFVCGWSIHVMCMHTKHTMQQVVLSVIHVCEKRDVV